MAALDPRPRDEVDRGCDVGEPLDGRFGLARPTASLPGRKRATAPRARPVAARPACHRPDAPGVREAWQLRANELGVTFDDVHREFAKDTPLRKVTALAQVADAVVLLASDLAAGMTATLANATGGAQIE